VALLEGEGLARLWTERALKRLGYRVDLDYQGKDEPLRVAVFDGGDGLHWLIATEDGHEAFASLGEMADYIKKNRVLKT